MSAMITLTGRISRDPELAISAKGKTILRLSVVTNGRKYENDKWIDIDTTFWKVTAFDRLADGAADHLSKGDPVIVTGKAKQDNYTDKDGNERQQISVIADSIGIDFKWAKPAINRVAEPDVMDSDPWATPAPF
jgi:single-strand DNA-binding protein